MGSASGRGAMYLKPYPMRFATRLYDDTPQVVLRNIIGPRQRMLAQIRYNRLVDRILGMPAYSLGFWSGKVGKELIEIDDVYIAVNRHGQQVVVPVQARVDNDRHAKIHVMQDIAWCQERLPQSICCPILAQFVNPSRIAFLSLCVCEDEVKVTEERHYELVPVN